MEGKLIQNLLGPGLARCIPSKKDVLSKGLFLSQSPCYTTDFGDVTTPDIRLKILRSADLHAVHRENKKEKKTRALTTNGAHFQQGQVLIIVNEASGPMHFIPFTETAHFCKTSVSNCPLEPSCRMICSCNRTSTPTVILAILKLTLKYQ